MGVEELVKKHMDESDWYNFPEESLRAALAEQAEAHAQEVAAYVNFPEYRDKNELQARIAQLEKALEWVSVKDQGMPFHVPSLGFNAIENARHQAGTYRITCPLLENTFHISHWMPLPPPPTDAPPQ